jgi:hypothetical protein
LAVPATFPAMPEDSEPRRSDAPRDDPWRGAETPRPGDLAWFRPDGLLLEVVRVDAEGVTTRVAMGGPEAERTLPLADWAGMLAEGTLMPWDDDARREAREAWERP